MRSFTQTMDGRIFLAILSVAGTVVGGMLVFFAILAASAIDQSIHGPEETAREHIRRNLDHIREAAAREMDDGVSIHEEATIDCWQENNPGILPSDRYSAQQCRIVFGSRPHGNVQADYTVVMVHGRRDPWAIFRSPNHPVADAYLDLDTIRGYPENRHIRPEKTGEK